MKIVGIVLGALLVIGGIYCMTTPVMTFLTLGWLVGAAMLMEGMTSLLTWNQRKALGFANGWSLLGAIVSILLGFFVVGSGFAQLAIDRMLAYLAAFWLIIGGVTRIMTALGLRRIDEAGAGLGKNWLLLLIAGILIVVMGVLCVMHPVLAMASIGFTLGLSVAVSGVSTIMAHLSL